MKLVVAIDGDKSAKAATDHILKEKSKYSGDTEISLIHVVVPGFADAPVEGIPDVVAEEKTEEQAVLDKMAKALAMQLGVIVTREIAYGEVADVIASRCKQFHADEVIVPSHARHGFSKLWFGSVADEIVDAVPCTAIVLKMPQDAK